MKDLDFRLTDRDSRKSKCMEKNLYGRLLKVIYQFMQPTPIFHNKDFGIIVVVVEHHIAEHRYSSMIAQHKTDKSITSASYSVLNFLLPIYPYTSFVLHQVKRYEMQRVQSLPLVWTISDATNNTSVTSYNHHRFMVSANIQISD